MIKKLPIILGSTLAAMLALTGLSASAQSNDRKSMMVNELAQIVNLSTSTLQSDLSSGKTISQILQQQGISQEQFVTSTIAHVRSDLDQKVQQGQLTQDQANQYQQQFQQTLNNNLNNLLNTPHVIQ